MTPEKPTQPLASSTAARGTQMPGWNFLFIDHFGKLQTAIIYNSHISYTSVVRQTQRQKIKAQRVQGGGYYNTSEELKFKIPKTPHTRQDI